MLTQCHTQHPTLAPHRKALTQRNWNNVPLIFENRFYALTGLSKQGNAIAKERRCENFKAQTFGDCSACYSSMRTIQKDPLPGAVVLKLFFAAKPFLLSRFFDMSDYIWSLLSVSTPTALASSNFQRHQIQILKNASRLSTWTEHVSTTVVRIS